MLTAIHAVEKVTKEARQEITILTCNQQPYRVFVNILLADPEPLSQFFPRLEGMHMLMSFFGCLGKLMGHSGLSMLMGKEFAGIEKILLGRKFPMNLRAL